MGGLTNERIAVLKEQSGMGMPPPPEDDYDSWFKYEDPTTMTAGAMNSLKMLGNIPYSAFKLADAAYEAGTDLAGVGEILLRGISGAGEVAFQELGLQDADTENSRIAREIGKFYIDRITNPGRTLVEDPMGALLDVSSPMLGGAMGKMAGVSRLSVNPLTQAIPAAAKVAGGVGKTARIVATGISTLGSMKPPRNFMKVFDAASEGHRPSMTPILRESASAEAVLQTFRNALSDLSDSRSRDYRAKMPKIRGMKDFNPQNYSQGRLSRFGVDKNLVDIRRKFLNNLKEEHEIRVIDLPNGTHELSFDPVSGIKSSGSAIANKGVQSRINRTLRELEGWTDGSPYGMDKLKRRLSSFRDGGGPRFKISNLINDEAARSVRKWLGDEVDGYNALVEPYEDAMKLQAKIDKIIGDPDKNPEAVLNKLTAMMGESAGKEVRRALVETLEKRTGKPLSAQIASLELSEWLGKGLFGHGIIWGAMYGITDFNPASFKALGMLPFTSPRFMGEFFMGLGATKHQGKKVVKFMQDIHDKLPVEVPVQGMTVLTAIERIDQHQSDLMPLPTRKPQVGDQLGDAVSTVENELSGGIR